MDYTALRRDVRRAVTRACPPWFVAHRDDLIQSAMMRLVAILERRADARFNATYLARVARCAVISEMRRVKEMPFHGDDGDARAGETRPGDPSLRAELRSHITAAMGALSADRRRAVALYLAGHGVNEASRVLGWNAKRTENLVHRGLRDLRVRLESVGLAP